MVATLERLEARDEPRICHCGQTGDLHVVTPKTACGSCVFSETHEINADNVKLAFTHINAAWNEKMADRDLEDKAAASHWDAHNGD